ncbi:MAG: winged helix-turn-helix transcriptional regulator [Chloroflexi bacterium]|nr:winged helix-turn-helix transcriptional regulator [Chloroflexota bacterium]
MDTTLARPLPTRHRNEPCCAPVEPPRLGAAQTRRLADRLKALADPTRLAILDLLAQQSAPLCVCDLTPLFDLSQPTISHHLRLLRQAGLIDTERQGIWSFFWATDTGRDVLAALDRLDR